MPFWLIALLVLSATVAFNYLTAKRTKTERQKPAGLGDFNFPTATEVRRMAVVVGTIKQRSPNCTWYGDLQTLPIKQKVPNPATFGLTKKSVETGQYRYFVGMMLGLAHGEGAGVRLREFQIDDKIVWTGNILSGTITFDKSDLFGGETKEGGYAGTFDYYGGTWTQAHNAYLQTQFPTFNVSRNPGESYIIQRGPSSGKISNSTPNGYVGIAANLRPYSFILQRFPDHLGQSAYTQILGIGDTYPDANPVEWLYEVLTNTDYGMGVAPGMIDLATFQTAAQTVFNEKIGLSVLWDTERGIDDVVNDIVGLIDGACYVDRSTGLWTVALARDDYDADDLPIFDEDNIVSFDEFGVNVLTDNPNHFIVPFVDKVNGWKDREADFKNLAAQRMEGAGIKKNVPMYGCSNGTLAAHLAFREAKVYASNLRKATFHVDRSGHWLRPLSVFKYRRLSQGIDFIIMRTMKINDGELLNGEIEVECLQDVFSLGTSRYAPPPITNHIPPATDPASVAAAFFGEQPYLIGGAGARLWAIARQPTGAQLNFDLLVSDDGGATYQTREARADYAPTGTVVNPYSKTTAATDASATLRVSMDSGLVRLLAASASDVARGTNLLLFADTGEICAFEALTDNGDGSVTLSNVWRGLLDTVPEAHAAGVRVWFFSYGEAIPPETYAQGATIRAKLLSNALRGQSDPAAATILLQVIAARSARPLPPANVTIQGVYNPTAIPAAGNNIAVAWNRRNRLTQTFVLKQTDADISPEVAQTVGIKVYRASGALAATYSGLTGSAWTYTPAMQTTDGTGAETGLTFVVYAERGGVTSFQAHRLPVARPSGVAPTAPGYSPSGTYVAPAPDTTTSVAGLPIIGTPSGAGQGLISDGAGGLIWAPSSGLTTEDVQDIVAAMLVAGAGISLVYNDGAGTLTVASSVDTEAVQDIVAALLQQGAGISLAYNDGAGTLTITATITDTQLVVEDCEPLCDDNGDLLTE